MSKFLLIFGIAGLLSMASAWLVLIASQAAVGLRTKYWRRSHERAAQVSPKESADPPLTVEVAGLDITTIKELADEEVRFPGLREVWVLARRPVDLHENFYSSVLHNIKERFVRYYYIVEDVEFCRQLKRRLARDLGDDVVDENVFFAEVDSAAFVLTSGCAIWLKDDLVPVKGTTITSMNDDGSVTVAQEMSKPQLLGAYRGLCPLIAQAFGRDDLSRPAGGTETKGVVPQPPRLRRVV